MPYSATSAAAVSSCVLSGLLAHSDTSAPPSLSASARLAVSVVTCRHRRDADTLQRALAGEPLPYLPDDRHLPRRPLYSPHPVAGKRQIADVTLCMYW